MPRFFNLVRRRKQPVLMSYVDEIKDEEVLRVVRHIRKEAGLPTLPTNGCPHSSGTMTTEASDDRSDGKPHQAIQPKGQLALVAEVGSEVQEKILNGPSSMRAVATTDPKMCSTPNQNLKKASSTRSWVKRASIKLSNTQKNEPFQPKIDPAERKDIPEKEPARMSIPQIDTSHNGSLDGMDSPSRYLPTTPKTPTTTGSFFCAPSLTCAENAWLNSDVDDRTVHTSLTDASWFTWTSRIRKAEHQLGISFIDNMLDQIVGEVDTFDGGTVMDESTIGPSLIFSPESTNQRAKTPGRDSPAENGSASYKGAQRIMGKLAKWDELDKIRDDESCTLFDGKDATDRTLALEFSQSAGSEYTSDFFTDDEETEMTGASDYTASVFTNEQTLDH